MRDYFLLPNYLSSGVPPIAVPMRKTGLGASVLTRKQCDVVDRVVLNFLPEQH